MADDKQNDDKSEELGSYPDWAAAIMGANCSTGMAVAAGIIGVGLLPAIPILAVGAVGGVLLKRLLRGEDL